LDTQQIPLFSGIIQEAKPTTNVPSQLVNAVFNLGYIDVMGFLSNNSVDMIFTDPPYGMGYLSNHYVGENPFDMLEEDNEPFDINPFLAEASRVLIDGGALYLCCRWVNMLDWGVVIKDHGLVLKNAIIWMKNNWTAGDLAGNFSYQYEMILFITKGRHILRGNYRYPNVWQIDRVSPAELVHPTQKPTNLVKRAIEASSDPGGWVVDPFCGSGTTGIACQETGRVYTLGDKVESMVDLTRRRLYK
jgi:site-specific DNA-methyltransferase (adenine-specific)